MEFDANMHDGSGRQLTKQQSRPRDYMISVITEIMHHYKEIPGRRTILSDAPARQLAEGPIEEPDGPVGSNSQSVFWLMNPIANSLQVLLTRKK